MRSEMYKSSLAGLVVIALMAATAACAQDVELLVKHTAVSYGPDGVKRSTEFSERVSRAKDSLWISRGCQRPHILTTTMPKAAKTTNTLM